MPTGRLGFQEALFSPKTVRFSNFSIKSFVHLCGRDLTGPGEAKGVGDGSLVLYVLGGHLCLVHSLCGDGLLEPLLPGVLGQLSGAQPTAGPQSCILTLQMQEMAPEPHRSEEQRGRGWLMCRYFSIFFIIWPI